MDKIDKYAEQYGISLFEALKNIEAVGVSKKIVTNIQLLTNLIEKYSEIDKYSIDELRVYRSELDVTYNTLVSKSSQLEYTNQPFWKKRVRNLSNLNHISRSCSFYVQYR